MAERKSACDCGCALKEKAPKAPAKEKEVKETKESK